MASTARSIFEVVTEPSPAWHGGGAAWLWDSGERRLAWANQAALALWGVRDFAAIEAQMDPRSQPGLAALARLSGNLPESHGRIERLRLFIGGRHANLTCHCMWHRKGQTRLLAVSVLDARGRTGDMALSGADLARSVLAGFSGAAMAVDEKGELVYANAPGMQLFFHAAGDGTPRHRVRGLETLAERALDDGHIEGRLRCGGNVVPVAAVPVSLPGQEPAFIAVYGEAAAMRREEDTAEAAARLDDRGEEATALEEIAAAEGSKEDNGPAAPDAPETTAGDAAQELLDKTPQQRAEAGGAPQAPAKKDTPTQSEATDVIFKPDWEEPREGADGRGAAAPRKDPPSRRGKVVPFRTGTPAGSQDSGPTLPLDPHERDAFRELARALGARIEGDERTPDAAARPEGEADLFTPATDRDAAGETSGAADTSDSPSIAAKPAVPKADLAQLLVRLPVGVLVYRDGAALFANRAFLDLFGFADIRDLAERGDVTKLLPQAADGTPGSGEMTARDAQGREMPVTARLQGVQWGGEAAMALSVQPAGAPEAPATGGTLSRGELAKIVKLSLSGLVIIDEDGRVGALDEAAEKLFARGGDKAVGQPFEALFAEESRDSVRDYLDGLRTHGLASILGEGRDVRVPAPGGANIPAFLTLGALGDDPKRRFCALVRDVSQWNRKEGELVRARDAAETASRQKSEFIAQMSHEMRTPLNSIIGFSEVIMEERMGNLGSDRYRDYLRDIHDSGRHLLGLVNDLLDLSKVEAGKMELSFAGVDINEIAVQCIRLMLPEANRGRVIMRSSLARELPPVVADARSLKQILLNLLSNAIKFTLPGGQVALATMLTPRGEVQIRVRDTGIGMEQQELAVAMEPYGQALRPAITTRPGTGLGLPLTKALTEANRARFRIESEDGRGTLTEVTFPSQRVLDE